MQDVIFSGTQNRKRLSYCEVSLVFDNSDKIFKDLDYTEVVFTRKLYRTGESEYYVNRQLSRLRNIVDYLREGGISKEGYTIIGQGKVAEILQSKPADRRGIFEEAVGISKSNIWWWLSGNNQHTIDVIKGILRESGLTFEEAFGGAK